MILSLVQLDCLYTVRTGLPVGLDGGISSFLFESVAVVVVAGWHTCCLLPPLAVGLPARVWLGRTATLSKLSPLSGCWSAMADVGLGLPVGPDGDISAFFV